ncbi:MAG: YfiR family protein [Bryobacterales bacterium]|nr:YfiR family protein [Bryobacterales bacterium]
MRSWTMAIILATLAAPLPAPAGGETSAGPEVELKAAVVFSFARFADWPEAENVTTPPVTIGVLGTEEFYRVLQDAVFGKTIQGRRVLIRQLKTASDAPGCQIVFVGLGGAKLREVLPRLRESRILTIGDDRGFLNSGGAVRLSELDGRIVFDFDADAVAQSGVPVNARLLRLGKAHKKRGTP